MELSIELTKVRFKTDKYLGVSLVWKEPKMMTRQEIPRYEIFFYSSNVLLKKTARRSASFLC